MTGLTMQNDLTKYSLEVPLVNHQANTVTKAFTVKYVCIHKETRFHFNELRSIFLSKIFT